jgi:hypothetical protein
MDRFDPDQIHKLRQLLTVALPVYRERARILEASGLDHDWVDLLVEEDAESRDSIPGRYRIHDESWATVVELLHAGFAASNLEGAIDAPGAGPPEPKRKAAAKGEGGDEADARVMQGEGGSLPARPHVEALFRSRSARGQVIAGLLSSCCPSHVRAPFRNGRHS